MTCPKFPLCYWISLQDRKLPLLYSSLNAMSNVFLVIKHLNTYIINASDASVSLLSFLSTQGYCEKQDVLLLCHALYRFIPSPETIPLKLYLCCATIYVSSSLFYLSYASRGIFSFVLLLLSMSLTHETIFHKSKNLQVS